MRSILIPIIALLTISFLLIGAVSAINHANVSTQTTVKSDLSNTLAVVSVNNPINSTKNGIQIVSSDISKSLIDSGANKFYWNERGGIFSYTWKTYKSANGNDLIIVHYKTTTNSWYGTYTITKISNNKLKIVYTSPEVKLYSGHPSETSYATTTLTPVQYYLKFVKNQIKSDGYFFV